MRADRVASDGSSSRGLAFASLLASVCAVLAWLTWADPRVLEALEYRRDAVMAGEAWRLVTAHVVHLSIAHAVVDVVGLLLVAWIFGVELGPRQPLVVCFVTVAAIDGVLWVGHPDITRYAGLSGVLHAWFAAGATCWALTMRTAGEVAGLARSKRRWGALLLAGLAAKLAIEARDQAFWLDGAGYAVVTVAHRAGALAGFCCGIASAGFSRVKRRSADAASPGR